jgi:hypothetical protein
MLGQAKVLLSHLLIYLSLKVDAKIDYVKENLQAKGEGSLDVYEYQSTVRIRITELLTKQ